MGYSYGRSSQFIATTVLVPLYNNVIFLASKFAYSYILTMHSVLGFLCSHIEKVVNCFS